MWERKENKTLLCGDWGVISLDLRRKHKTGKKGLRHRTKLMREQKSETPEVSNLFEGKTDLMTHVLELKAQNLQMVPLQPVSEDHITKPT